jgi:hypothetical protein
VTGDDPPKLLHLSQLQESRISRSEHLQRYVILRLDRLEHREWWFDSPIGWRRRSFSVRALTSGTAVTAEECW